MPVDTTKNLLAGLEEKKLAVYKRWSENPTRQIQTNADGSVPPLACHGKGLSLALAKLGRSQRHAIHIPDGGEPVSRSDTDTGILRASGPAWLKSAWPQAEIWAGWSEVRIPGVSVIPDGLAWGRIQGYETLFWLEVGDSHKSRDKITNITTKRLDQAWELCERTGVRLVYAQLSTNWVHEVARWACVELPNEVAVVMGNQQEVWGIANY